MTMLVEFHSKTRGKSGLYHVTIPQSPTVSKSYSCFSGNRSSLSHLRHDNIRCTLLDSYQEAWGHLKAREIGFIQTSRTDSSSLTESRMSTQFNKASYLYFHTLLLRNSNFLPPLSFKVTNHHLPASVDEGVENAFLLIS